MLLEEQSSTSASLLSFVPRSVVLARISMTTTASNVKPDSKMLLLQSICRYLKASGFSKTVKKFKSEAKLDEAEFEDTLIFDLGDVWSKHLETRFQATMKVLKNNGSKENSSSVHVSLKKKKVKNNDTGAEDESGLKEANANLTVKVDLETEGKTKEKKKSKKSSNTSNQGEKAEEIAPNCKIETDEKLQKSKKKNKKDSEMEDLPVKTSESKKRKRMPADDDTDQANDDENKESGEEESATKKSDNNLGTTDGMHSNNGDESSGRKSAKKPRNGSAEPTTLKAFQRVKVDEVVIKDERLKDNSYWAKDGAESGYGAKAQEILGQVRGKDFRHEKTKKKRGSYRGGQIDFNSHSIKFNDSDDE